jgi:hypothetical protein
MKDPLKERFKNSEYPLSETPPEGHRDRFKQRLTESLHEKEIHVRISRSLVRKLAIAATVVLAVVFVWLYQSSSLEQPQSQMNGAELNRMTLAAISDKYSNVETFFSKQVNHRLEMIENSDSDLEKTIYREAIQKLTKLEKEYKKLEYDLALQPDNSRIIHAMIQNYQLRIKVLENLYSKIELKKTHKNEKNEKAYIQQPDVARSGLLA